MWKVIVACFLYVFLLLAISSSVVVFNVGIHEKYVPEEKQDTDKLITSYLQTGDGLSLTKIEGITNKEVRHMFDVRQLIVLVSIVSFIFGIILLWLWEDAKPRLAIFLAPLVFTGIILPTLALMDFTLVFENFHKLFFPQGNYTFPMTSALISTYSEGFFAAMSVVRGEMTCL